MKLKLVSSSGYKKSALLILSLLFTVTAALPVSASTITTFNYTGGVQTYTAPYTGTYTLETGGAEGGSWTNDTTQGSIGGFGGYSKGNINLTAGQTINVNVGGQGQYSTGIGTGAGWNGGGNGGATGYGGGGATDIRVGGNVLSNRVIVAGGGGGTDNSYTVVKGGNDDGSGGAGGGITAGDALLDGVTDTDAVSPFNMITPTNSYFTGTGLGTWIPFLYGPTLGDSVNISEDNSTLYKSSPSMKITKDGWGDSGPMLLQTGITPNTNYVATMYVNIPASGTTDGNGILCVCNALSNTILSSTHLYKATSGWTKVSLQFNSSGETSVYWRVTTGDIPVVYVTNFNLVPLTNSGVGATQTTGYSLGTGESVTTVTDTGGAGGGYYGGNVTNFYNGGGGGGSGYTGGVTNSSMSTGVNTGNGYAKITSPTVSLSVTTAKSGNGTGTISNSLTVNSDTTIILAATPDTGNTFVNWTNNIGNPIVTTPTFTTPTITSNVTYTANFMLSIPADPTNITPSNITPNAATLSWTAGSNDTSYKIYQNTIFIGTSTTPTYTATSLQQSNPYSFTVSGYNISLESDQSLPCLITTTQTVNSLQQTSSSQTINSPLILTDGVSYYDPIAKATYQLNNVPGLSVAHSSNEYTGAKQAGATKIMLMQ